MDSQDPNTPRLPPREVHFDPESGHLVVRLEMDDFDLAQGPVKAVGSTFEPKGELHITIVSRQAAETVQQHLQRRPGDEARIREQIDRTDWSYRKQDRFYHVVEEPGVESIIRMVSIPGLESFFDTLGQIVGASLELPPTHVTLYTRGDPDGIGIPTREAFDRLVQGEIDPDEITPIQDL